jgi:hypothetical protein
VKAGSKLLAPLAVLVASVLCAAPAHAGSFNVSGSDGTSHRDRAREHRVYD